MSCSNSSGEAHPDVGQRCVPIAASSEVEKLKRANKTNKKFSLIEIKEIKQVNVLFLCRFVAARCQDDDGNFE